MHHGLEIAVISYCYLLEFLQWTLCFIVHWQAVHLFAGTHYVCVGFVESLHLDDATISNGLLTLRIKIFEYSLEIMYFTEEFVVKFTEVSRVQEEINEVCRLNDFHFEQNLLLFRSLLCILCLSSSSLSFDIKLTYVKDRLQAAIGILKVI